MSTDLCYVLSHGFAARMILHSDVLPELVGRGLSVALILPGADDPELVALAARLGVRLVAAPPLRSRASAALLNRTRPYVLEDVAGNPALRAKHERARAGRPLRRRLPDLPLWLNRTLRRSPLPPALFARAERTLLRDAGVARLLAALAPGLVVSTYPVNLLEAVVLHEAERAGIPTVGQLLSWDNITAKGRFLVPPRHYLSWGPIMTAEIRQHYPDAGEVHECGVAHFDRHVTAPSAAARTAILGRLGLDPARPYLFFGMSSPYFAPHEIDVVEWLAARVAAGGFGPDLQLVVRPHPQNVQGHMADQSWLGRLARIVGPRVTVDYPSLGGGELRWAMKEEDLPHLANLLAGCAVSLNSGSTLSIDAMVHDRPIVMTAFDADRALPWWRSARRVLEYPHLAKLLGHGGVRIARDFAELERHVAAYLADPTLDAAARAASRAAECGPADGRASARVAAALAALLPRRASAASPSPRSPAGAREVA